MKARLIVAAVGIPLLLAVLCFAPPWAVTVLFSAVTVLGTWELFHILHIEKRLGALILTMAASAGVQLIVYFAGYEKVHLLFLPFALYDKCARHAVIGERIVLAVHIRAEYPYAFLL